MAHCVLKTVFCGLKVGDFNQRKGKIVIKKGISLLNVISTSQKFTKHLQSQDKFRLFHVAA